MKQNCESKQSGKISTKEKAECPENTQGDGSENVRNNANIKL